MSSKTRDAAAIKGVLRRDRERVFIEDLNGRHHLEGELIWRGYVDHFLDCPVHARALSQKDYARGHRIQLLWPDEPSPQEDYVEIYYNERLVKYRTSLLGHNAVNVNGRIFNFSHLMNENEILTPEEYFYRPALGEFAPSPTHGGYERRTDGRSYLDKFGRRFMRSIHAIRVLDIDASRMNAIFEDIMNRIHRTPSREDDSEKWRDFHPLKRNCTTLVRDGLNAYGFTCIRGRFPRDLFVNAAYHLSRRRDVRVEMWIRPQLKVVEAPYSAMSWLLAPNNYWRRSRLSHAGR